MTPVTPTGLLTLPLGNLATLISNCTAFRTWTGTATAALALARIHYYSASATSTAPFVVIDWGAGGVGRREVAAGTWEYEGNLGLRILFCGSVSSSLTDDADAMNTFANSVGEIMAGIEGLSGTSTYQHVLGWRMEREPTRVVASDRSSRGDMIQAVIRLEVFGI